MDYILEFYYKVMTQKDKLLLLQDLCARLPYYPKCEMIDEFRVVNNEKDSSYISTLFPKHIELLSYHNNFIIKPYLRQMSSMTDEEKKQLDAIMVFNGDALTCIIGTPQAFDWLNKNHFDYHGLIEKELALEAPKDMYN